MNVGILHAIQGHADTAPDALAVTTAETAISFGELARRASELATRLSRMGFGAGARVAFALPRSAECAVAILGILETGAAFVPLDPSYPSERKRAFAGAARVDAVVTDSIAGVEELNRPVVLLGGDTNEPERRARPSAEGAHGAAPAYCIPTSGSTGTPKCVGVGHASLANYVDALGRALGVTRADRWLHTASFAFSASVRQLLVPLAAGASVCIVDAAGLRDAVSLVDLAIREGITVIDSVPSYLRALAPALADRRAKAVRYILSTGEPLPTELATALQDAVPRARIVNLYGQTETTGSIAALVFDRSTHARTEHLPIGPALAGTELVVLDDWLPRDVARDAGELCVVGSSLAHAYVDRPELTAERFVPYPHGAHGARVYRTGDLVRRLPRDALVHSGRIDHQVKLNGIRVDLGEIEAAICRDRSVAEATVLVRGDADRRLVAYVVPKKGLVLDVAALRSALAAILPDLMIPRAFVSLESMPRTVSGKVDRAALPAPATSSGDCGDTLACDRSRDVLEDAIVEVFADVLGLEAIDASADFFELGGDSMQATQTVVLLRQALPLSVPWMNLFFDSPTPRAIAAALRDESEPERLRAVVERLAAERQVRRADRCGSPK